MNMIQKTAAQDQECYQTLNVYMLGHAFVLYCYCFCTVLWDVPFMLHCQHEAAMIRTVSQTQTQTQPVPLQLGDDQLLYR